jgi:hypothetical protein
MILEIHELQNSTKTEVNTTIFNNGLVPYFIHQQIKY